MKHKKLTHNKEEFKILGIGKNMGGNSMSQSTLINKTNEITQRKTKSMFTRVAQSDENLLGSVNGIGNFGKSSVAPYRAIY